MATRRMSITSLLCDGDKQPALAPTEVQSTSPVLPSYDPERASPDPVLPETKPDWNQTPPGYHPGSATGQAGHDLPVIRSHTLSGPGRPPILISMSDSDPLQTFVHQRQSLSPVQQKAVSPVIQPIRSPSHSLPPQSPYQEDMGGLAALVHAATQERRRLSSEIANPPSSSPTRQGSDSPTRPAGENHQTMLFINKSGSSDHYLPTKDKKSSPVQNPTQFESTKAAHGLAAPLDQTNHPDLPSQALTMTASIVSNSLFPSLQSGLKSRKSPQTPIRELPAAPSHTAHVQLSSSEMSQSTQDSKPFSMHTKRPSTASAEQPFQKRRKSGSPVARTERKGSPRRPGSAHLPHGVNGSENPAILKATITPSRSRPPSPSKHNIGIDDSRFTMQGILKSPVSTPKQSVLSQPAIKAERTAGEVDAHEWLLEHYTGPSSLHKSESIQGPGVAIEPVKTVTEVKRDDADVDIALMVSEADTTKLKISNSLTPPTRSSYAPLPKEHQMEVDVDGALAEIVWEFEAKPVMERNKPTLVDSDSKMDVDIDGEAEIEVDVDVEVENELLSLVSFSVQPERAARKKKERERIHDKVTGKPSPPTNSIASAPPKPRTKAKPAKSRSKASTSRPKNSFASTPSVNRAKSDTKVADDFTQKISVRSDQRKDEVVSEREDTDQGEENTKLYCVCQTLYEADKIMIACDRCDGWYHPPCVGMPEDEIEIVDQFICPPCVTAHPELSLQTTYKSRCGRTGCKKAARGSLSNYCSDACGIQEVESRMNAWGGDKQSLWPQVQNAARREGFVCIPTMDGQNTPTSESLSLAQSARIDEEIRLLKSTLDDVVAEREIIKADVVVIQWRQRAIDLATARASRIIECGWDQRLCYGAEEFEEFGDEVLASYESDENGNTEGGEWFCRGKHLKCDRHAGWQKLRTAEAVYEREMKDITLQKLTTREREIRKRIEDLSTPPPTHQNLNRALARIQAKQ